CGECGANAALGDGELGAEKMMRAGPDGSAEAVAAVRAQAVPMRCRRCGGELVQRTDDSDAGGRERLKGYRANTQPLVDFYRVRPTFRSINGAQAPDRVAADLAAAIEAAGAPLRPTGANTARGART